MSRQQGRKLTSDSVGKNAETVLTERNEGGEAAGCLPQRAARTSGTQGREMSVRREEGKAGGAGESGEKRRGGRGDAATSRPGGEKAEMGAAVTASASKDGQFENIRRDLVLNVEVDGREKITMMDLLRAVSGSCGRVIGCRQKGERRCELLMESDGGKEKLLDGFKIKGCNVLASEAARNERMVSFMSLPVYTTDAEILAKLKDWKVEPASPIRRRKWPETDICDGTRFLKVRFPDSVSSLPYSTRFETLEGVEYFRVIHDQQRKLCRLCLQPGHILRECEEFKCHKCHKVGHYARECGFGAAARTRTEGREEPRRDTGLGEMEEEEVTLVEEAAEEEQEQTGGDEREGMEEEEMEEGEEEAAPMPEEAPKDLQPSEQPTAAGDASTHPKPATEGGRKYAKIFGTMRLEQQSTGGQQTRAQGTSGKQHRDPMPAADPPACTQQVESIQPMGGEQRSSAAPAIIMPATLQGPTKQSAKQPDETAAEEESEEEAEDSEGLMAFNSGVERALSRQRERMGTEGASRQRSRSSRRGERGRSRGGGQRAPSSDTDREVAGQPKGRGAKRKEKKKP